MIFYFSGTGNTRWAAEHLAAATGERLLFIPEELKGDCHYLLAADERIGFCFPTHGWQPPHIVRQFIRQLQFSTAAGITAHYCFALTTCGDSIGRTMEILNRELAAVGLHATSVFSLTMPESYVCLPFMNQIKYDEQEVQAMLFNGEEPSLLPTTTDVDADESIQSVSFYSEGSQ